MTRRGSLGAAARRAVIASGMATQARIAEALGTALDARGNGARLHAPLDLSTVSRAIVVRPDEIGDVVLTSAFLREFRRLAPAAHVTLVTKPETLSLAELCPYVDDVRVYVPRAGWRAARPVVLPMRALRFALAELRPARPDLAVLPRWDGDQCYATFVARWSGARVRVGYSEQVSDYRRMINRGFDRLLTHTLDDRTPRHDVERSLDVIRALGGDVTSTALELWLDRADHEIADRVLAPLRADAPDRPIVAIGVGAGHAKRRWPAARFADVARTLQQRYGVAVAVIGAAADIRAQETVLESLGPCAVGLAGLLTLRETAAALSRCALYVGNDSGPMHLAAAGGVPVVEISCHPRDGSPLHENAPERFAPWGVRHAVLRPDHAIAPCTDGCSSHHAHCVLQVHTHRAVEAAGALLHADEARADTASRSGESVGGDDVPAVN